mgnify:CR=1 FL=1
MIFSMMAGGKGRLHRFAADPLKVSSGDSLLPHEIANPAHQLTGALPVCFLPP